MLRFLSNVILMFLAIDNSATLNQENASRNKQDESLFSRLFQGFNKDLHKYNTKRNKTGFLCTLPTSLNSSVKRQVSNFFSILSLISSIKNIKQNIRENIVHCFFYETGINFFCLLSKTQPPLF